MISHIAVSGYKCLMEVGLECSSLNVMVGSNASGKSSFLQTMLLLKQSIDTNGYVSSLILSGPLYEAGTAQDIFHPAAEHSVSISISENNHIVNRFEFSLDRNLEDSSTARVLPVSELKALPRQFSDPALFSYLNAERFGPRISNPLPAHDRTGLAGPVGKFGEFTAAVLARSQQSTVDGWLPSELVIDAEDDSLGRILSQALERIDQLSREEEIENTGGRLDSLANILLGWIIPGAHFVASEYAQNDVASLRYLSDISTRSEVRSTHIGFGLSYTLPIIVAALAMRRGGILIVENPEAHLHPYSQSRMGAFLAIIASTGRQIFVETHSDHVVNGIRLAVKLKTLPAASVRINFFEHSIGVDRTRIIPIELSENGRLSNWPVGFFDQIENDLSRL